MPGPHCLSCCPSPGLVSLRCGCTRMLSLDSHKILLCSLSTFIITPTPMLSLRPAEPLFLATNCTALQEGEQGWRLGSWDPNCSVRESLPHPGPSLGPQKLQEGSISPLMLPFTARPLPHLPSQPLDPARCLQGSLHLLLLTPRFPASHLTRLPL